VKRAVALRPSSSLLLLGRGRNPRGGGRNAAVAASRRLNHSRQPAGITRQVLLYCFRLDKCGTFMPLSRVQGESRIAVVWTLFVLVFSSVSSVHFSILFTRAITLSAADCG